MKCGMLGYSADFEGFTSIQDDSQHTRTARAGVGIQVQAVQYLHVVYALTVPGGRLTGCHQMQNGTKLGSL